MPEPIDVGLDEGFLAARDGVPLHWRALRPERPEAVPAHVAIVHGYAEHLGRQMEVARALVAAGHVAHLVDVRGHGKSGGKRAHVARFKDYVDDLEIFLAHVTAAAAGKPLFLVAHSHGALIAACHLLEHPGAVRGAVFSSPYFRLKLPVSPVKLWAGRAMSHLLPGMAMSNELRAEQLTHDAAIQAATRADPLYQQIATPGWFVESSAAQARVLDRAGDFRTPLLVLAGGADPITDPAAGREFFEKAGSQDKAYRCFDGLLHEIFNETERAKVLEVVTAWIGARAGGAGSPPAGAGAAGA
jgi:lysophospholipase